MSRPGKAGQSDSPSRGQRVSLKDIADELGISQTAVSFAINDRPGVSAETKRRVKETAAKLGWSPVYAAQALGSSKTMTVGFAPARARNGIQNDNFMMQFMAGIHQSLSRKGYGLLFRPCGSDKEAIAVYRDWARRKRVDGVILADLYADDPRPSLMTELGLPAVLAGGPDPSNHVPSLSIDDSATMRTILEHLSLLGHKRIAYLSGDGSLDYSRTRVAALQEFGKRGDFERIWVEYTGFDSATGVELTQKLLTERRPPTAFIYETDTMAAASLRALSELLLFSESVAAGADGPKGRGFPYDLPAIVSFEDSIMCETAFPSITAVHRDASLYGTKVANLLLKVLAGESVAGNRRILTPRLIVRESTRTVFPRQR
ncbi:LacI family DNA-binding transcriptional regulator [Bifidobacterium phasiani]|uniref:LacI family DNA-binding transcriptional regulator n=1 Tax=Bifidobacterium phasiani TaxID=2834431 RepID=A0ABS6W9M7_9BIFI|nr:LacI family DNA-binding transcriptional regulator [Bifidobacterium phasiani]MBW3083194.1 LacI family DNA-binding transcriptional regulator [Bifidobacterium phasiani]